MSTTTPARKRFAEPAARALGGVQIDVVVPVYNEEAVLERSIRALHGFLSTSMPFSWRITIADNASTDRTWQLARRLAAQLPEVHALYLNRKGRGRALRQAWSASPADVLCYMDVDCRRICGRSSRLSPG